MDYSKLFQFYISSKKNTVMNRYYKASNKYVDLFVNE